MLIAILVVLGGIVAVALGRGGELSQEPPDFAPMDMGPVSATDVVLLRPPTALWGYNMQVTDDALERIAASIRERDVRIVALEQRVADLAGGEHYAPLPSTARHARRVTIEDMTPVRDADEPAETVSAGPESGPEAPEAVEDPEPGESDD
jgi:hypothetical protein